MLLERLALSTSPGFQSQSPICILMPCSVQLAFPPTHGPPASLGSVSFRKGRAGGRRGRRCWAHPRRSGMNPVTQHTKQEAQDSKRAVAVHKDWEKTEVPPPSIIAPCCPEEPWRFGEQLAPTPSLCFWKQGTRLCTTDEDTQKPAASAAHRVPRPHRLLNGKVKGKETGSAQCFSSSPGSSGDLSPTPGSHLLCSLPWSGGELGPKAEC